MGMWDALCKLNMKYGSEESKLFIDDLLGFMFRTSVIASARLAKEKGVFPKYSSSVLDSTIIRKHFTEEELNELKITKYGLRNCSLLSIAPSGSIGTMLNISTGCEPAFQIKYTRKTESLKGKDEYYDVYIGLAKQYMEQFGTDKLPDTFITSGEISWKDRIDMQSALQEHIDTAISSTVNLPNSCTQEEIEQLYLYAWEKGLKGVTIFRDGCKRAGILITGESTKTKETITDFPRGYIVNVNDDLIGYKRKINTGCGSIHFEVYFDENTGNPQETFINIGSSGGCERNYQFISRLISLALRAGVPIESIIDQANSIRPCNAYVNRTKSKHDTSKGTSCPSAIGYALKEFQNKINKNYVSDCDLENNCKVDKKKYANDMKEAINDTTTTAVCPECGSKLQYEGGCVICKGDETHDGCGWSRCD